jgi:aflatoxin B1 aldehyde reductase
MSSTDNQLVHQRPKLVLGCMEFGRLQPFDVSHQMINSFIEIFKSSNAYKSQTLEFDTAHVYGGQFGISEAIIGKLDDNIKKQILFHTKANPLEKQNPSLSKESVLTQCKESLERLQLEGIHSPPLDIYYLHAPDPNTPIEETLGAINELYKQGKFKRFGVSNYKSWEVAEIYYICRMNNYVLPTVYQGMYNLIARDAELELLPCLRKLGISFYAYNPLGGGLLTGRYEYSQGDINRKEDIPQGRFTAPVVGDLYRERYWKKSIFEAIDMIKQAINGYNQQNQSNLTLTEVAFRWNNYHSKLSGEYGDAILMGSSKPEYLIANTKFLAIESPLPESILSAIESGYQHCKQDVARHWPIFKKH